MQGRPVSRVVAALVAQTPRGYALVAFGSIVVSCSFALIQILLNGFQNIALSAHESINIEKVVVAVVVAPIFESLACYVLIQATFFIYKKVSIRIDHAVLMGLAFVFFFGAITHAGHQGMLGVPGGIVIALFSIPIVIRRFGESKENGLLPSVLIHSAHNIFVLTVALSLSFV